MILETNKEKQIQQQINDLYEELEETKGRRQVTCPNCKKRTPVNQATIIIPHYYVAPYSCTGGAYWDRMNEYQFYCEKCDSFHRAYTGSFDKDWVTKEYKPSALKDPRVQLYLFIKKYESYFGEKLKVYGDRDNGTITHIREVNKKRKEREDLY